MIKIIETICVSLLVVITSCIEPYEFVIDNGTPNLVVEGFISDVSFNETIEYPSDGRYFNVILSYTGDVTNRKGEAAGGAIVNLISDNDRSWTYTETDLGKYLLLNKDFKARTGERYKLRIKLSNGEIYESNWQTVPAASAEPIGDISFVETEELTRKYVAQEDKIVKVKGIDLSISIPVNESGSSIFYVWDFEPMWVFKSPLFPAINHICWVTSDRYLSDYVLHEDLIGGYKKPLAFIQAEENERFVWDFSLLVKQYVVDDNYYNFLRDIKIQADESLGDAPPYNLLSNIVGDQGKEADGYFAVVGEKARRWYFNQYDLTYTIQDVIKVYCENPLSDKGPVCWDCLAYGNGIASTRKPVWWRK